MPEVARARLRWRHGRTRSLVPFATTSARNEIHPCTRHPSCPNVGRRPGRAHEIEGDLRVVNLADDQHFTALSYVWGTFAPEPHYVCSGTRVKITENGHSALHHLRKKLGSFTIWVDNLCISQDDQTEKSHQIPLMRDIYSKAAEVFIWLGEGNTGTDRAMSWLSTAGFTECHFGKDKVMDKAPPDGNSRPNTAAVWPSSSHPRSKMVASTETDPCQIFFQQTIGLCGPGQPPTTRMDRTGVDLSRDSRYFAAHYCMWSSPSFIVTVLF
ncbi:hypothetical protein K458DRAFT_422391 [Lentithecium fluviatile CBS 122367]|uniref:Heterokaryon incompatibility domain-containing protein n=1 Tax=Lentithecium fluviatile CBS 122367 TaxID=1168545 RepID=A0A6G1IN24_9PLEO|nr:hypothetical protein K458DRAFT_422391 [Lentithecium fluviatile CBS 122367]